MDMLRMAFVLMPVNSSLAWPKRCFSWALRPKALITRMPARFSCITTFTLSSFFCTCMNSGLVSLNRITMTTASTGIVQSTISDSRAFSINTAATPPMHKSGERTSMPSTWVNAFCTWVTSLVVRVTSEPVENLSMLAKEKDWILRYTALRRSRAKP